MRVRLGSTGQLGRLVRVTAEAQGLEVGLIAWDDGTDTETGLWLVVFE